MKQCTKCKIIKPFNKFWKEKRFKIGYRSICKECMTKENKYHHKKWFDKNYSKFKTRFGIGINTIRRIGLETALIVYDRDKRQCVICKDKQDLTIDHIDGKGRHYLEKGLAMNNHPDNLRLLCRKCHGSISGKLRGRKNASLSDNSAVGVPAG